MEFILLGICVASLILMICTFITLQDVREELEGLQMYLAFNLPPTLEKEPNQTPDKPEETPEEPADLSDLLTDTEIARIEREKEFDTRIAQIKEELASRVSPETRRGTEPMILHPHVHNLPHTSVPEFSDELPDVEITI